MFDTAFGYTLLLMLGISIAGMLGALSAVAAGIRIAFIEQTAVKTEEKDAQRRLHALRAKWRRYLAVALAIAVGCLVILWFILHILQLL